jgi:DNA-binding response OmpR family regulator
MTSALSILVVEDDLDWGDLVAAALRDDGHAVLIARDGESALAMMTTSMLDAVLLDLGLPDRNGYDLALQMREAGLPESATIIMVTGDVTAELDRANAVGIDIVLYKPVDTVMLGRLIDFVRTRRRRRFSLSPLRVSGTATRS